MRNLLLVILWFPFATLLLTNNLLLLWWMSNGQHGNLTSHPAIQPSSPIPITIATDMLSNRTTQTGRVLGITVQAADARPLLLTEFLTGSPLAPYSQLFVDEADRFQFDFRLLPAIAMCESNLGIRMPSSSSHNAWGIGVYTGQLTGATFRNWNSAISWVSRYFSDRFVGRDISDLRDIGAIWAPPSVGKGHSWANCVGTFMEQIL